MVREAAVLVLTLRAVSRFRSAERILIALGQNRKDCATRS